MDEKIYQPQQGLTMNAEEATLPRDSFQAVEDLKGTEVVGQSRNCSALSLQNCRQHVSLAAGQVEDHLGLILQEISDRI